ncbi:F0F1 ATP synthase subunit gamma [Microbulbifer bruguierae]|uniref:F0F1 ATP synthase subunit gamma n=1 Tax=Microbulbifer bruguierae TaxID=3029061 RepID=A0ABY8NHW3_9GAMM|nr:F0F1 ATP synthase subunit gamma [Microbulbifer bruguierae]WGL17118.1 F0F1 ATP synthase subunit gamma [Microbulbifer bruguierae]
MSRRHELLHHQNQLSEARQIIGAMQSLAFIEVRRLRRVLEIQQGVVAGLYRAARDLLGFHSELLPEAPPGSPLFLVLGSERGFCGDFNEPLLQTLQQCLAETGNKNTGFVACGRKLSGHLETHPQLKATFEGATVLDEVDGTLIRLANGLAGFLKGDAPLIVIYHGGTDDGIIARPLLPPFAELRDQPREFAFPPQLNVTPTQLMQELADQYLFAALHEILYVSLMAENHRRMQHLEGAVRHLDKRLNSLKTRENQLRQEEIIEEIEVILLNAENVSSSDSNTD